MEATQALPDPADEDGEPVAFLTIVATSRVFMLAPGPTIVGRAGGPSDIQIESKVRLVHRCQFLDREPPFFTVCVCTSCKNRHRRRSGPRFDHRSRQHYADLRQQASVVKCARPATDFHVARWPEGLVWRMRMRVCISRLTYNLINAAIAGWWQARIEVRYKCLY